jgi:hypothetical protein
MNKVEYFNYTQDGDNFKIFLEGGCIVIFDGTNDYKSNFFSVLEGSKTSVSARSIDLFQSYLNGTCGLFIEPLFINNEKFLCIVFYTLLGKNTYKCDCRRIEPRERNFVQIFTKDERIQMLEKQVHSLTETFKQFTRSPSGEMAFYENVPC